MGKVDDRILQLARFRSKKPNENGTEILIKKDGFKPGITPKVRLKHLVYVDRK